MTAMPNTASRPSATPQPSRSVEASVAVFASGQPDPRSSAEWLLQQAQDPRAVREWASALRRPVETVMEEAIIRDPERMARVFAPLIDQAHDQQRLVTRTRNAELVWRWFTGLTTPKVWAWTLQALWEGENPWSYIEEKALWYEVVEAVFFDPRTSSILARAESPNRALLRSVPALDTIPFLGSAIVNPERPAQPGVPDLNASARDGSQILVLVGERCRLVVRVSGQPPLSLRAAMQSLCFEADNLIERAGTMNQATRVLLEKLTERALRSEGPSTSAWAVRHSMAVFSLVLIALSALLTWVGVREYRWQTFLATLRSEPGLQVVEHSSAWGQTRIVGVRELTSRDPASIASEMGIDLTYVTLHFPLVSAYAAATGSSVTTQLPAPALAIAPPPPALPGKTSVAAQALPAAPASAPAGAQAPSLATTTAKPALQPANKPTAPAPLPPPAKPTPPPAPVATTLAEVTPPLEVRAPIPPPATAHSVETIRSLLRLPESIKLSISGRKLSASGALAEPDYTRLAEAPQRFAWVVEVDMAGVQDITSDEIKGHQRAITATRIGFKPESDAFDDSAEHRLSTLAKDIQALVTQANLRKQQVHLTFQTASQDGSDADSPITASRRAALQLALMRQGVQPECFADDLSDSPAAASTPALPPDALALSVALTSSKNP